MKPRPLSQGRFVRKTAQHQLPARHPQRSVTKLAPLIGPVSRRRFFQTSAGLGGILFLQDQRVAEAAHGNGDPKPIPQGLQVFAPDDLTVFHVLAPGYPGFGMDPATNDASVITDFNGTIGLTYVAGMGTHTDKATNTTRRLPFEVDMRFMEGTYIAVDGKPRHRTFAFVWLDVYEVDQSGQRGEQIHDLNPGITESGLFWIMEVDSDALEVNPGNGRSTLSVQDAHMPDYFTFVNSLLNGPSTPAVTSFRVEWYRSSDKRRFRDEPTKFDANVVINSAQIEWNAETADMIYVSDPLATSENLFSEVGRERNGVFF